MSWGHVKKCSEVGCKNIATHSAHLMSRTKIKGPLHTSGSITEVCEEHAKTMNFNQVITDNCFATMVENCIVKGVQAPIRMLCQIKFKLMPTFQRT